MKKETILTTGGRDPDRFDGAVNVPVFHASTIAFASVAQMEARYLTRFDVPYYGRSGTPTTLALERAVAEAEGAQFGISASSGLAAICGTLLALLKPGDHLLMVDSVYHPARVFCDRVLTRFGVETTYYDPLVVDGLRALVRPGTRVVFCESPGSLTFEVQDIPAIAKVAHDAGALVVLDNTWASPLYFAPFQKGVDLSIQAATKYIGGHSDIMLGTITTNDRALYEGIKETLNLFGYATGSEEAMLALRGLRTLSVRLERHARNALEIARWLEMRPEVERVLYPALESDPGHLIWKRDFTGASGLMGVVLNPASAQQVARMVDGMRLFTLGFSWGGFESLILVTTGHIDRTARPWTSQGPTFRLHVGLENVTDLIDDLQSGFDRLGVP